MTENKRAMALVLAGILFIGLGFTMSTVVIDLTAPVASASTPSDGATYSTLDEVSVYLVDPEAGVRFVSYTDTSGIDAVLISTEAENPGGHDGLWTSPTVSPAAGLYSFTFSFDDYTLHADIIEGAYRIYSELLGNWYIDDQVVTPASIVKSPDSTIDVKFIKTAGVEDSEITCTFEVDDGPGNVGDSFELGNTAANTWTGTFTFAQEGTYSITMTASDGIGDPIVASIMEIGGMAETPSFVLDSVSAMLSTSLYIAGILAFAMAWRERRG